MMICGIGCRTELFQPYLELHSIKQIHLSLYYYCICCYIYTDFLNDQSTLFKDIEEDVEELALVINTYFVSIPRLSINLMTSVMQTAVVEKYRSPDGMVLVYRSATV